DEQSRIPPTCGFIPPAMWAAVVAEVLDLVAVGTNCIPRKTKADKIEVSFASLRKICSFCIQIKMATQFTFRNSNCPTCKCFSSLRVVTECLFWSYETVPRTEWQSCFQLLRSIRFCGWITRWRSVVMCLSN